jgi:hypothetical protein
VVLESTDAAYLTIDAIHRTVQDSSSASDRCVIMEWMQWDLVVTFVFFILLICRAGLLHLTNGLVGAALPPALTKLRYAMAIVELEDEGSGAIHGIVGSLLMKIKGYFRVFENSFPYATEFLKTALSAVF